jgi:L-lactate dehydrogenase
MVPIWSTANIGGAPLRSFPRYNKAKVEGIFDFTKKSGAEVIRLKGGAGYHAAR